MASVVTRSPNKPKYRRAVDKTKYDAMKKILAKFFPRKEPEKTQRERMAHAKNGGDAPVVASGPELLSVYDLAADPTGVFGVTTIAVDSRSVYWSGGDGIYCASR